MQYRLEILGVVVLLAIACGSRAPEAPAAPAVPNGPSVPVTETAWVLEAPRTPAIVVSERDVRIGEGAALVTLQGRRIRAQDKQGGESGFLVPALTEPARALPEGPVALAIDPATPYRTVTEVLYTIGQVDRTHLAFLVREGGALRALPIELPGINTFASRGVEEALLAALEGGAVTQNTQDVLREADPEPAAPVHPSRPQPPTAPVEPQPTLNLSATLTSRGLIVTSSGGKLAAGCRRLETGDVITVPLTHGTQDIAGLRSCLAYVKQEFPDETLIIISADPEIPFSDLVATIAASRGSAVRPLFPRTMLSAGVR